VEIGASFNGVIALQFLQTEVSLDMKESSRIFEETSWRSFRFNPQTLSLKQNKTARHNTIAAALSLSADENKAFWKVYDRYEDERDAILGDDYGVFALYAGEASDFNAPLAKRLGYNFLNVIQREIKLKEKYFLEMNTAVGSSLAARFLAWEDYYSLITKMQAWENAP